MCPFDDLLDGLRTQEAIGQGTDVRLVLLELMQVEGRIHEIDEYIAALAGRRPGLVCALRDMSVVTRLSHQWEGIDLEEQTTRLREVDDLLRLLT